MYLQVSIEMIGWHELEQVVVPRSNTSPRQLTAAPNPGSQPSPAETTPSPQWSMQSRRHRPPLLLLGAVQSGLIASVVPQSHCSSLSTKPLPHSSVDRQSALQPSPATVLPSSQASPVSTTWLPQPDGRQTPA